MVTFPSSAEAAALALAEHDLEVGLHLDLVGGQPLSDPADVWYDRDGYGFWWFIAPLFSLPLYFYYVVLLFWESDTGGAVGRWQIVLKGGAEIYV